MKASYTNTSAYMNNPFSNNMNRTMNKSLYEYNQNLNNITQNSYINNNNNYTELINNSYINQNDDNMNNIYNCSNYENQPEYFENNNFSKTQPIPKFDMNEKVQITQNSQTDQNMRSSQIIKKEPAKFSDSMYLITTLQERITTLVISENQLKLELTKKEKQLSNLKSNNEALTAQNDLAKKQYCDLQKIQNESNDKLSSLQSEYNNLYSDLAKKTEDINILIDKNNKSILEIEARDKQIETLNSLVLKYENDIAQLESQSEISFKNNEEFQSLLEQKEYEYNILKDQFTKSMNENMKMVSDIELNMDRTTKNDKKIKDLEEENKKLTMSNYELMKSVADLKMEVEKLKEQNDSLNKSKNDFIISKTECNNENNLYNNEIIKLNAQLSHIITICNENIFSLSQWIESYMPTFYSSDVVIPDIKINSSINSVIDFNNIKKIIISSKNKIDGTIAENNNIQKQLKNNLQKGQEENVRLNKYIEDLFLFIYNKVEQENLFNLNFCNYLVDKNYQKNIQKFIDKIFKKLKEYKNVNEQMNNDMDKLGYFNTESDRLTETQPGKRDFYKENLYLNNLNHKLSEELNQCKEEIRSKNDIISRQSSIEDDNKKLIKDNVNLINKIKVLKKLSNDKNKNDDK